VSGYVTVSRSGRIGSASGRGSVVPTASSTSGISTTSSCGVSTSAIVRSPSPCGGPLLGPLDRNLAGGLRQPGRQLDPEDPVLVGCLRLLGAHVHGELDDSAEGPGRELDLLVGAPLCLTDRPLAADHERAAADLEV